jgi:hypothetical protein
MHHYDWKCTKDHVVLSGHHTSACASTSPSLFGAWHGRLCFCCSLCSVVQVTRNPCLLPLHANKLLPLVVIAVWARLPAQRQARVHSGRKISGALDQPGRCARGGWGCCSLFWMRSWRPVLAAPAQCFGVTVPCFAMAILALCNCACVLLHPL